MASDGRFSDVSLTRPTQAAGLGEAIDRAVARIRAATEAFKSLDEAVKKGYARGVPSCVEHARDVLTEWGRRRRPLRFYVP